MENGTKIIDKNVNKFTSLTVLGITNREIIVEIENQGFLYQFLKL